MSEVESMQPEDFIDRNQEALAQQDWKAVNPLLSKDVVVTFSNEAVHKGREKVRIAFEYNFKTIKSESYTMKKIHWLRKEEEFAVFAFEYDWSGIVNGEKMSGNGIGTSIIIQESGKWQLLSEHLGKKRETPNK